MLSQIISRFCAFALVISSANAIAFGDYMLPHFAEDHKLITDNWKLEKSKAAGPYDTLKVVRGGRSFSWPIEVFWLADRIDSNSICGGGFREKMASYLDKLAAEKKGSLLQFELVSVKKGEPLSVAGIWKCDFKNNWERAQQQGSTYLNLSAEKVRTLKDQAGYEKAMLATSNKEFADIEQRK